MLTLGQMLFAFATQIRERQINPSLEMLCCDPSQLWEMAAVYEIFRINKVPWAECFNEQINFEH